MIQYLFVYGTLRSDCDGVAIAAPGAEGRALLRAHAELVGLGHAAGRLYAVDWYPALVRGRGRVTGEVWRIRNRGALLPGLQAYEGPEFQLDESYPRPPNGKLVRGLTYRFVGQVGDAPRIDSGDYRAWALAQTEE